MKLDSRFLAEIPVVAAVVDAGNFIKAGEALGLSQSGVSRAVQRLEQRLGARLFERSPQAVRLTEAGRLFCEEVIPLLGRLEEAAGEAVRSATAVRGRLRINSDPTFARLFLVPRLGEFLDAYPEIEIELTVRDSLGDLVAEGFDAAIRFGEPEPSSLIVRRLLAVRVVTCAAPEYLGRRGRPASPEELKGHECLLFRDSATGKPFPWEFHRGRKIATVSVGGRLVLNDALTQLEACLAGMGVAQLFDLGLEPLLDGGRLVQLFPEWSDECFPLHVYHSSRNFVPAKLRAFLDFVALKSSPIPVPGAGASRVRSRPGP